jgi:dihydroxy-acid dehydratase
MSASTGLNSGSQEARYIKFKTLPDGALNEDGNPALNKYSSIITAGHDFPGAQVCPERCTFEERGSRVHLQAMLYAAGVPDRKAMKNAPHVGIASVWWEGNPCK